MCSSGVPVVAATEDAKLLNQETFVVAIERQPLEDRFVEQFGGALDQLATLGGNRYEDATSVVGIGGTRHPTIALQARHRTGRRRRMDLQSFADLADRQLTGATKTEQPQHLKAGKGEPIGSQHLFHMSQQQLLRPHHRRDQGHTINGIIPPVGSPMPCSDLDRIDDRIDRGASLVP